MVLQGFKQDVAEALSDSLAVAVQPLLVGVGRAVVEVGFPHAVDCDDVWLSDHLLSGVQGGLCSGTWWSQEVPCSELLASVQLAEVSGAIVLVQHYLRGHLGDRELLVLSRGVHSSQRASLVGAADPTATPRGLASSSGHLELVTSIKQSLFW